MKKTKIICTLGPASDTFEKIAAHTGVKYNEMADRLAKQAIGIEE